MKAQKFKTPTTQSSTTQSIKAQSFRRSRGGIAVLATMSLGALAAGCGEDATSPAPTLTYNASLAAFDSCAALDEYIVDAATDALVSGYAYGGYRSDVDFAAPTSDAAGGGGEEGAPNSPGEVTGTNNQELGVDESDMVKTDGNFTYVLVNQTVHVLEAWPAEEMHEVATFDLTGWGDQMFLDGDRLVVFSYVYTGPDPYGWGWGGMPYEEPMDDDIEPPDGPADPLDDGVWFTGTRVTVLDVSDPANPTQAAMFDVQGDFVSARMVDGEVYLVSRSNLINTYSPEFQEIAGTLQYPDIAWDAPMAEREAAAESLRDQVRPLVAEYVAESGRDALIPDMRTSSTDRANMFSCGELMRPGTAAGLSVLSVVGFDPQAPAPSGVGIVADGWQVYGSQQSIYVAQDSRWWNWGTPDDAFTATDIHKFALNGGSPIYQASGQVDGWLLDQFSMSEHNGVLRVATTDQSNFGWAVDVAVGGDVAVSGGGTAEPERTETAPDAAPDADDKSITELREDTSIDANNVFTLRQNGASLDVVGGIRGIAPGERIFAVRFLGDTGYVVTFEQVDPLFVVDLTNPEAPALRGELKIPGYSGYLHPMGDNHLIGIGRDGTDEGQILGVQISLFDVSNPDAPTRVDDYSLAHGDGFYGWSEAEHDHHAFTFYESRGLLAIPVTLEDYGYDDDGYSHFSGIVVFRITEEGISEFGRVSHTMMSHDRYCDDIDDSDPEPVEACADYSYSWWVNMRRSIFADDYLYAISDMGVTASSLDALDDVLAEVRF